VETAALSLATPLQGTKQSLYPGFRQLCQGLVHCERRSQADHSFKGG